MIAWSLYSLGGQAQYTVALALMSSDLFDVWSVIKVWWCDETNEFLMYVYIIINLNDIMPRTFITMQGKEDVD